MENTKLWQYSTPMLYSLLEQELSGKQAADLFEKYSVFDYVREFYDVLYTTGYQYINQDIDLYLRARNAEVPVQ